MKGSREGSQGGLSRFVLNCAFDLFSNFRSNLIDVVNGTCVRGCLLQNVLFGFTFCHEPAVKPNIPTTHDLRHHSTSLQEITEGYHTEIGIITAPRDDSRSMSEMGIYRQLASGPTLP
jgi:hypothetical protein